MPDIRAIPITNLLLDPENARLENVQASQNDTVHTILKNHREKVLTLADHIVENGGLNPLERQMVIPDPDDENLFVAVEGNRRLMALKLLATPNLGDGLLTTAEMKRLKTLSEAFQKKPISVVDCVVVADRDEADPWIQIKHRGQMGGAGPVPWDAIEGDRYDARRGKKSPELQVIDFVLSRAKL